MNFSNLWVKYLVYIIDILIVAYAFYRFLFFIRGTKAVNILWGLFLVAIFTIFSIKLKLPITSWLLKQFWLAGIIILAIVFQPELRNILSEISLPKKNYYSSLVIVEEIISAIKDIIQNKDGALIVIERKIGLKNFTQTGILLDANVSKELITSIFYKENPLHDGAIIISKEKIIAAKCILPLCEEEYCKPYGTRHRAALGITQISDAIAIVISEERSTISLAIGKQFYYNITIEKLREILNKEFKNNT